MVNFNKSLLFYFQIILILNVLGEKRLSTKPGKCPELPGKPNFDFYKYEGYWFTVEVLYDLQGIITECSGIHYQEYNEADKTFVLNSILKLSGNDIISPGNGTLYPGKDNTSIFLVDSFIPLPPKPTVAIIAQNQFLIKQTNRYFILDTDYSSYTIEWICNENYRFPGTYTENIWISSRGREYLPGAKDKVYQVLTKNGFDTSQLLEVVQTNCSNNLDF